MVDDRTWFQKDQLRLSNLLFGFNSLFMIKGRKTNSSVTRTKVIARLEKSSISSKSIVAVHLITIIS